jgi:HSP20 family protein
MSNLTQFDPFNEMRSLQKQFFGDDFWLSPLKGVTIPTTDVYTNDDKELIVEAHLPNFSHDDIDVHADDGALVIQAEKHEHEEDKKKKYVVRESSSSFYRRITLPDRADSANIDAHLDDGILKVIIPLRALPEPKKIKVTAVKKAAKK